MIMYMKKTCFTTVRLIAALNCCVRDYMFVLEMYTPAKALSIQANKILKYIQKSGMLNKIINYRIRSYPFTRKKHASVCAI